MELSLKKILPAFLVAGAFGLFSVAASAGPCPALGNIGAGCNETITLNAGTPPTATVTVDNSHPYDGADDQLVGVVNNTGLTVTGITITGAGIAGFDGDGGWAPNGGCITAGSGSCFTPSISNATGQYSGPNNLFTVVNINTINDVFATPLAPGGTTYFTLETPPTGSLNIGIITGVPEPATLSIRGAALAGLGLLRRRRRIA